MEATLAPDSLLAQVQSVLNRSPLVAPHAFRVEADAGTVRLQGEVGSFYQKQMAQELIRRVDGVERIENCLRVIW